MLVIVVTLAGIVIVVTPAYIKAFCAMPVTPSGIATVPTQLECPVTTLLAIVNVPLVPQLTVPSATACAAEGIPKNNVVERVITRKILIERKIERVKLTMPPALL